MNWGQNAQTGRSKRGGAASLLIASQQNQMSVPKAVLGCGMHCGEFAVSLWLSHSWMSLKKREKRAMKYSKLQLNLPYPGIHSVVLTNLQSGRQGEEHIWNMLAASMSCHPVHQRSPIPFVIKGINVLPSSVLWQRKKRKLAFHYCCYLLWSPKECRLSRAYYSKKWFPRHSQLP